jgi:hypothetical protein
MAPAAVTAPAAAAARGRSGRLVLSIFLLLCIAPIAASYFFYFVVKPEKRTNYGDLIEQRPVPALAVSSLDGKPFDLSTLSGSWVLLSTDSADCPVNCARKLFEARQIRIATGKDRERVQTVWLVTGTGEVSDALKKAYPDTLMLRADAAAVANWLPASDGDAMHLYLVDPHQHLMMRFPSEPGSDEEALKHAYKVKRDLTKLLNASEIG